jgi:hypothetical protein
MLFRQDWQVRPTGEASRSWPVFPDAFAESCGSGRSPSGSATSRATGRNCSNRRGPDHPPRSLHPRVYGVLTNESARTKAALTQSKKRLGGYRGKPGRSPHSRLGNAAVVAKADAFTACVRPTIEVLKAEGKSLHQIAAELTARGRDDVSRRPVGCHKGAERVSSDWIGVSLMRPGVSLTSPYPAPRVPMSGNLIGHWKGGRMKGPKAEQMRCRPTGLTR